MLRNIFLFMGRLISLVPLCIVIFFVLLFTIPFWDEMFRKFAVLCLSVGEDANVSISNINVGDNVELLHYNAENRIDAGRRGKVASNIGENVVVAFQIGDSEDVIFVNLKHSDIKVTEKV